LADSYCKCFATMLELHHAGAFAERAMLQSFLCLFGRHRVSRREVEFDGMDFRGPCKGCGRPMIKDLNAGWRRVIASDPPPADSRK